MTLNLLSAADESLMILPSLTERSVFENSTFFFSCKSDAENVQRIMWTGPEGQQITEYQGRSGNDGVYGEGLNAYEKMLVCKV